MTSLYTQLSSVLVAALLLIILCSQSVVSGQLAKYNIANSSTISWTNTNNSNSYTVDSPDGVRLSTIILLSQSNDSSFACGLICDDFGTTCLFGVFVIPYTPHGLYWKQARLIWSANRNRPVTVTATLELRRDGGLLLMESNGSLVWSTHSDGSCVSGLELTERGNLVIFGQINETIWQSFDHPTEALVPSTEKKPRTNVKLILVPIAGSMGVLLTVTFYFAWIAYMIKRMQVEDEEELPDGVPGLPTRFSYQNLSVMTENFSRKLGEGGFGSVFEGALQDGTKVAVKRLRRIDQVKSSFWAEVAAIGSIEHANLVKLIGFCAAKPQRLLVYEYMANCSLDTWIFNGDEEHGLSWNVKNRIMSDIAKGLAYLHEDCNHKIIHLDIKPQNILLDQNFNAKVADFGLSKLVAKNQSKVVTMMMRGTPGYLAPEWMSMIITEKVDVYSFGIVMLEIVCGRKNVDQNQAEDEVHLLSLFKKKIEEDQLGEMFEMYNKDLEVQKEEAVEIMRIAAWCLQNDFRKRPSMSVVVKALQGLAAVETNLDYNFCYPPNPRSNTAAVAPSSLVLIPSILSGPR